MYKFNKNLYKIEIAKFLDYDIMGHANTGSGKTAAFLLPIIQQLHEYKQKNNIPTLTLRDRTISMPCFALILCPTRELAQQLFEDAKAFTLG